MDVNAVHFCPRALAARVDGHAASGAALLCDGPPARVVARAIRRALHDVPLVLDLVVESASLVLDKYHGTRREVCVGLCLIEYREALRYPEVAAIYYLLTRMVK